MSALTVRLATLCCVKFRCDAGMPMKQAPDHDLLRNASGQGDKAIDVVDIRLGLHNAFHSGSNSMSISALVLTLLIAWALLLLVLMEALRSHLVVTGRIRSNEFTPDNSNTSLFMQRLARAHANCVESLTIFGGLLVVALATGRAEATDALAPWLLAARIVQSSIHLTSTSVVAVNARFTAFAVQMGIGVYWVWALLAQ